MFVEYSARVVSRRFGLPANLSPHPAPSCHGYSPNLTEGVEGSLLAHPGGRADRVARGGKHAKLRGAETGALSSGIGTGSPLLAFRARPVNRCRRIYENVSKCVADLYRMPHDSGSAACLAVGMLAPCPECGHSLWMENRGVGTFNLFVYFDDDEQSDSYAEQVTSCPTCHNWCGPRVYDSARGLHYASRRG